MIPQNFSENIEQLLKLAGTYVKLSSILGAICIVIYSIRIGHFPKDLSLSDGLQLLVVAAGFGLAYCVAICLLAAIGISAAVPLRSLYRYFYNRHLSRKGILLKPEDLYPFHWLSVPFACLGFWVFYRLGHVIWYSYLTIPAGALYFYVFLTAYRFICKHIDRVKAEQETTISHFKDRRYWKFDDINWLKRTQLEGLLYLLGVPLLCTGFTGTLLDVGMMLAGIRVENTFVYLKEPYSSMIPSALKQDKIPTPKDYQAFKNIKILFTGIGKTTVLEFTDSGVTIKVELPTDAMLIISPTAVAATSPFAAIQH